MSNQAIAVEHSSNRSKESIRAAQYDQLPGVTAVSTGSSVASRALRVMIGQAAVLPVCRIMIEGAAGVEKNAVAEAIHNGRQNSGLCLTINCSWEKDEGAYNRFFGAGSDDQTARWQPGYLERAAGGTLILDDVTELPRNLQASLLSFIDTGSYLHTDGLQPITADMAIIGIARSQIQAAINSRALSEGFYLRLAQLSIKVPDLQQRAADKIAIAEHLLTEINAHLGSQKTLSEKAMATIERWSWPGNIHELKTALYRSCLENPNASHIELPGVEQLMSTDTPAKPITEFVGMTFWQIEKELLYATLEHYSGDKEKTAGTLGISLKTLYNRLHAYS